MKRKFDSSETQVLYAVLIWKLAVGDRPTGLS